MIFAVTELKKHVERTASGVNSEARVDGKRKSVLVKLERVKRGSAVRRERTGEHRQSWGWNRGENVIA